MRKVLFAFSCVLVFFVGSPVFLYYTQEYQLFRSKETGLDRAFSSSYVFEEIFLEKPDAKLHAIHYKQPSPKGVVLYFHGRGSNLYTSWGKVGEDFVKLGYDCFILDYRGFGKSSGVRSEQTLLEDAETSFAYVRSQYNESDIVIYGRSLGTGFATYVAANHDPRLLLLESPYYSMLDLAPRTVPYLPAPLIKNLLKYPLRTDLWIQNVKCPIHMFHSLQDELIPYDSSLRLLELIQENNQAALTFVDGVIHHNVSKAPLYKKTLKDILAY